MDTIRALFDPQKHTFRTIEKVISFGADTEHSLKSEVMEYVVTESIERQFEKLLDDMERAMETGGESDIGVWVSGFYGSGKSSLTKYLGLSLDEGRKIEGTPFLTYFQDRFNKATTKARLATIAKKYPAAVVMLDLATDQLGGASQEEVSTVLYFTVLQWAGYSRNLKVAAFERLVDKEGRREEIAEHLEKIVPGITWADVHNNPLMIDGVIAKVAHAMYPNYFPTESTFSGKVDEFLITEGQRVQEMLDIIKEKSGKENVVFIIDEVGQYVGPRPSLILNMDGLAKNLKIIGGGKAIIIATAQQMLTENSPLAALNSAELYKLNDRFPIQIDLESSDIREICFRRLLGKSSDGEKALRELFEKHGQALRHNTKLDDAKSYDTEVDADVFQKLYPFLPAHFDILLHLLGALAKTTGGVGLRSAIKIIQDVLKGEAGRQGLADAPIGRLATLVTLFDELERDIRKAFAPVHEAVGKVKIRFPGAEGALHCDVAKSVAVLQILGSIPVTVQNIASLMHPSVQAPSRKEEIEKAVEELLADVHVSLGEKDGQLEFLSEKLRDIEKERSDIPLRSVDLRRIGNESLRNCFDPLPRATILNTMAVTAGLKVQSGTNVVPLAGDSNPIQFVVEVVHSEDYEVAKQRVVEESRSRSNSGMVSVLAKMSGHTDELAGEIYRSRRISELHRMDPDQEVRDYCNAQLDRANHLEIQLQSRIKQVLQAGSFVFRGEVSAVSSLDSHLNEASKKLLGDVAKEVFHRYSEAPVRVGTDNAEKILKVGSPTSISAAIDPLGLVKTAAGQTRFATDHKAMISIRDYVEKRGTVEGKRLLEDFAKPPFGWSQDTTRYILSVMLIAGEIKLKISGRDVTTAGDHAVEALKTNKSFRAVGVSLRDERPSVEVLGRAAKRLSELVGERVLPLEQEVSKVAAKHLPRFQQLYGTMSERLRHLSLPGVERMESLSKEIADVLFTDASDAPERLGAEASSLYDNLVWAGEVKKALGNGLDKTISSLQSIQRDIAALPNTGIPAELKEALQDDFEIAAQRLNSEEWYANAADLNSTLTGIKSQISNATTRLAEDQKKRISEGLKSLARIPYWSELTQEEQGNAIGRVEDLKSSVDLDLNGLRKLITADYDIHSALEAVRASIQSDGEERTRKRLEEERKGDDGKKATLARTIKVPSSLSSRDRLIELIGELASLREEIAIYPDMKVTFEVEEV